MNKIFLKVFILWNISNFIIKGAPYTQKSNFLTPVMLKITKGMHASFFRLSGGFGQTARNANIK